jgi:hypothetical protein
MANMAGPPSFKSRQANMAVLHTCARAQRGQDAIQREDAQAKLKAERAEQAEQGIARICKVTQGLLYTNYQFVLENRLQKVKGN